MCRNLKNVFHISPHFNVREALCIIFFVGHPNVIQKIRCEFENINAQIKVPTVQVDLDEMKFAFIVQLKQQDISSAYPTVKVQFNSPHAVTLRGRV